MAVNCPDPNQADRINEYALVSYIPEPLGSFLDRLRLQLVPSCHFRSHVTILPPRALACPQEDALEQLARQVELCPAFELTLGSVEIFKATSVIYLGLGNGREQIEWMHSQMNTDCLWFKERFEFHPHVTLAQEFPAETVTQRQLEAQVAWAGFPHHRTFPIETLTFVQRTSANTWINLAEYPLKLATVGR